MSYQDAAGLADAYVRLRAPVRKFAWISVIRLRSDASRAATRLRSLAGYVEGLIATVVLDEDITMAQIQAAREAARRPPGFT